MCADSAEIEGRPEAAAECSMGCSQLVCQGVGVFPLDDFVSARRICRMVKAQSVCIRMYTTRIIHIFSRVLSSGSVPKFDGSSLVMCKGRMDDFNIVSSFFPE